VLTATAESHEHARNEYLDAVTTPWVLVLDADERLTVDAPVLRATIDAAPPGEMGFSLTRFDYTGRGHFAETPLVRLFRSHPAIRYFPSRAHASVVPAIEELGGRVSPCPAPLHHLDALLPGRHQRKRAGMIARLSEELALGGLPVMHCFLALELFLQGQHAEATRHLEQAVEKNPACEPISRLFRAQQALRRGERELAEHHASWVVDSAPHYRGRAGAFVVLAEVLHARGASSEAISLLRRAVTEAPSSAALHLDLAALLEPVDVGQARTHLALARQRNPWLGDPRLDVAAPPNIFEQQQMTMSIVPPFHALAARLQWSGQ
jgi:tetratricopeptide (TPR) repeat protein